ncbi:MAG: transcriptional regulator [Cryobacterium sp.]|nr:transcriptional regulator [Cryobacterium sp.]
MWGVSSRRNPGSQSSLREANRARIVEAITHHGALTQVELAGVTGLSPATVSNIVKEQAAAGVLQTTPTSRSGRRAVRVTLAREMGLVVGLHVANRQLRLALADAGHQVLAERMLPLARDHRADSELDRVMLLILDTAESVGAGLDEVLAVGVGLAAPVDPRSGIIATRGLLRGWDGVPVAEELESRLHRPVFVDNEANLGALAEYRMGAAQGFRQAAYLRVSHGVGAGLIVDGRVYRGGSGKAGEIGHLTLDEHGQVCRCGSRGCLETLVGSAALAAKFPGSHVDVTLRDILLRADAGDASARRVIADAGRHLGIALAGLSNLIDPHRIVVGGELAEAGELLLSPLRHALERSTLATAAGVPDVVKGELGERAEVLGAVLFAIDRAEIVAGRFDAGDRAPVAAPPARRESGVTSFLPQMTREISPERGGLAS